jgi:serine/threonine-protein kinase
VDLTARLNGALDGRYRIERQIGEGDTLRLRLEREGQLSVEEAVRIIAAIAAIAALEAADERGIIHRDMTP